MKNKEQAFIIVAAILWGSIGIFVKNLTANGLSNNQAIFVRVLVGAVGLVIISLIKNPALLKIRLKDLPIFLGTGCIGIAATNIAYFKSIELTSMGIAAMLMYTAPAFVMLMSALFYKESITRRKLVSLVCTLIGSVFISNVFSQGSGLFSPLGILCGLASGLGYALYSIISVYALRRYDALTVTTYTFIVAAVTMAFFARPHELVTAHLSMQNLLLGLGLGVVAGILPYLLYTRGLSNMEAGRASILASLEPLAATIFGVVIFKEKFSLSSAAGIVFILAAIILLNTGGRKSARQGGG